MSFPVELPFESYRDANLANFTATPAYDLATARALAWLSQLAYETRDPEKVAAVLKEWQLTLKVAVRDPTTGISGLTDTHGLIVEGWGATIIAFTGTDPLKPRNWVTDFNIELPDDNIHAGFRAGFEAVRSQIEAVVGDRGDRHKRLFITGHSAGGALAAVAAKFLQEAKVDVEGVYTFGMPRCGGAEFARVYEGLLGPRTYRLVHGDDVVPKLPPPELHFQHVGRLLKCPHGGAFEGMQPLAAPSDEPHASVEQFVGSVLKGIGDRILPSPTQPGFLGQLYSWLHPSIGDHLPSRYLRALERR
jgi:hypothetical protein